MVLPPIEKTPLMVIRFTKKASLKLIELVKERMKQGGLIVLPSSFDNERLLYITATQAVIEMQAERIHLMKVTSDTNTVEYYTVRHRRRFVIGNDNDDNDDNSTLSSGFFAFSPMMIEYTKQTKRKRKWWQKRPDPNNRDAYGLFTANEWSLLLFRILDGITVLPDSNSSTDSIVTNSEGHNNTTFPPTTELSRILDEEYRADYYTHNEEEDDDDGDDNGNNVKKPFIDYRAAFHALHNQTSKEKLLLSSSKRLQVHGKQTSVCLWHVLQTYRLVDTVAPLHLPKIRQEIINELFVDHIHPMSDQLLTKIQEYYGWEIAFYFAWMGFLTRWLLFPGVLGVVVVLLRWYRQDTANSDEYTPLYGLINFFWGILFLKFWERYQNRLAYRWGTFSLSPYEKQKYFTTRPEFCGYMRISPVTGLVETYYPPVRRRIKYVISAIATIAMLSIAFITMILSLNLQGYIHPKTDPTRWNDHNPHPFYVASVAYLAEEGRWFDAKSKWCCYIPVILHSSCIFTLNKIYRTIGEVLTTWENHETEADHRNSLILKRFLFEAFDCYVALFYLAFYERDVNRLQMELIAVYQIDTLRRVLIECLIPMLLQRMNRTTQSTIQVIRGTSATTAPIAPTEESIADDLEREEYEQFDDYMEIVIQLGYVTLFASAYPLASIISIGANWIEIRSDCLKLAKVCRRPRSFRSSDLGVWKGLIATVLWTSALTNCLIAGFTSGQLQYFLPGFYVIHHDAATNGTRTRIDTDDDWLVVFLIFGLERLLLVAGILIYLIVPSVPEDVTDELERRQYARYLEELEFDDQSRKAVNNKKDD